MCALLQQQIQHTMRKIRKKVPGGTSGLFILAQTSKQFGHSFAFDAPTISGMNYPLMFILLPLSSPSGRTHTVFVCQSPSTIVLTYRVSMWKQPLPCPGADDFDLQLMVGGPKVCLEYRD